MIDEGLVYYLIIISIQLQTIVSLKSIISPIVDICQAFSFRLSEYLYYHSFSALNLIYGQKPQKPLKYDHYDTFILNFFL